MTPIRKLLGAAVAGVVLTAGAAMPTVAAESPSAALAKAQAQSYPGEGYSQYYRRGYYGGRGYRRGPSGGAIAGGVIGGLALGALAGAAIAGSQPAYGYGPGAPVGNVYGADPAWVEYCASKYRSFDPRTGTYLARDGYRYPCE